MQQGWDKRRRVGEVFLIKIRWEVHTVFHAYCGGSKQNSFWTNRKLNFGIDFKGGTKIVVDFGGSFDKVEADGIVKEYADDAVTKTVESTQYEIKSKDLDETKTAELFDALKQKGYEWDDKNLKLIKIWKT